MTTLNKNRKNEFRGIKIGDTVDSFHYFTREKIEGSEGTVLGNPNAYYTKKVYSAKPTRSGVVTEIKGHNAYAARITFADGSYDELGLTSHYHINGKPCAHHKVA